MSYVILLNKGWMSKIHSSWFPFLTFKRWNLHKKRSEVMLHRVPVKKWLCFLIPKPNQKCWTGIHKKKIGLKCLFFFFCYFQHNWLHCAFLGFLTKLFSKWLEVYTGWKPWGLEKANIKRCFFSRTLNRWYGNELLW